MILSTPQLRRGFANFTDRHCNLFVCFEDDIKIANPHVFLFPSADAALTFAIRTLLVAGLIIRTAGGVFWTTDRQNILGDTPADALKIFQEGLGASEYFHIYETTA